MAAKRIAQVLGVSLDYLAGTFEGDQGQVQPAIAGRLLGRYRYGDASTTLSESRQENPSMSQPKKTTAVVTIDFHGQDLVSWKDEDSGEIIVSIREMCHSIGISPQTQLAKLRHNPSFTEGVRGTLILTAGGRQEVHGLLLELVPGWLATINPARVKDLEIHKRLLTYQRESYKALSAYWTTGIAVREEIAPDFVDQYPELRAIRELLVTTAEARHDAEQAKMIAHDAEVRAVRAEAKADMALDEAHRMTIEEFVVKNGLLRQFPERTWAAAAQWLLRFCGEYNLPAPKVRVPGKSWTEEHSYPLQALSAWVRHASRLRQQDTLSGIEEEGVTYGY